MLERKIGRNHFIFISENVGWSSLNDHLTLAFKPTVIMKAHSD
jgi:hypothetical protein